MMNLPVEKQVEWDIGTAYDFFISLWALHEPEHLGLRGSWAAGVRSRLPAAERDTLQRIIPLVWPLPWVYTLTAPKDVAGALTALRALDGAERLRAMIPNASEEVDQIWREIAEQGAWTENQLKSLMDEMQATDWKKHPTAKVRKVATQFLDLWVDPHETADALLDALESYHEVFFTEEEARIAPALQSALDRAQEVARSVETVNELLVEITQGVRLMEEWEDKDVILAPSYWGTPLALIARFEHNKALFMFGARPAGESLIPGDLVPDALHQALKALADPTRLRILRYLMNEPCTPAELARRLRLRAPTVIHHLDSLRLARLVMVTLEAEGKRYAVRAEAIPAVFELLEQFLGMSEE